MRGVEGPRPGGVRLGRWYFNRKDRRRTACDRWGLPITNRAHPGAWLRLLSEAAIILFAASSLIGYALQRLHEGRMSQSLKRLSVELYPYLARYRIHALGRSAPNS